jgi:hypothetical protein
MSRGIWHPLIIILTGLRPAFEEEGGAQPQTPGRPPFTIQLLLVREERMNHLVHIWWTASITVLTDSLSALAHEWRGATAHFFLFPVRIDGADVMVEFLDDLCWKATFVNASIHLLFASSPPLLTNVGNEEYTLLYRPQERQPDALFCKKQLVVHLIAFQVAFSPRAGYLNGVWLASC